MVRKILGVDIPVPRVSDFVRGGSLIWYSREIDLCSPSPRDPLSRRGSPHGRWVRRGKGEASSPSPLTGREGPTGEGFPLVRGDPWGKVSWAEVNFPRVSDKAPPFTTSDTLVTGMGGHTKCTHFWSVPPTSLTPRHTAPTHHQPTASCASQKKATNAYQ